MNWKTLGLYFAIVAFLAIFFVLPVAVAIRGAFLDQTGSPTLAYLLEVFRNPLYAEGLLNSLKIAVGSTLIAFLLAAPLTWLNQKFDFGAKSAFSFLLILPLMSPPFVGAIGLRQILGQEGALNALLHSCGLLERNQVIDWLGNGRAWGVILMNALHLYPILYLNLRASLANVDPSLLEAAENLGCRGLRRACRVTLPLILPGIFAGGSIVFIWSFTELGVPLMFDYYRITSVQIFDGIRDIDSNPMTYALVAVTLAATAIIYFPVRIFLGSPPAVMPVRGGHARDVIVLRGVRGFTCSTLLLLVCGISLLPQLSVVFVSFSKDWYRSIFPNGFTLEHYLFALGNRLTIPAIQNSLFYASLSTCIDLIMGVAIAYLVTRTRITGRTWLDSLAMLPLSTPGLVLAIGYLALTRRGSIFSFLDPVQNPLVLLV
ncbi:MAG: ABC transporter permease, partial [Acidobacteria bacterium]